MNIPQILGWIYALIINMAVLTIIGYYALQIAREKLTERHKPNMQYYESHEEL